MKLSDTPQTKPYGNLIVLLSLSLGTVLFGSVVFLLFAWHDLDAVLYAVLGAAVGWGCGILIAPYPEEAARFAQYAKTVSAFVTGYLITKIEAVWGLITDEQHRGVFFEQVVQRRFGICAACFVLVAVAVFKSRSYLRGSGSPISEARLELDRTKRRFHSGTTREKVAIEKQSHRFSSGSR